MLWLWLAVLTVAAEVMLVVPLWRARAASTSRGAHDLEVYRDQLRDVEADLERGILSADEAAAVRLEVQRRMLAADADRDVGRRDSQRWRVASALVLGLAIPGLTFALYGWLGTPELPSQPLVERPHDGPSMAGGSTQAPDLEAAVVKLVARLEEEPGNLSGWVLLARSYQEMERYAAAAQAYRRAVELADDDPDLVAGLAVNLMFAAEGVVTPTAQEAFQKTLALDPGHPGARYYLGVAYMQGGRTQAAFDMWLALAADTPVDAPWYTQLRRALSTAAEDLGVDLAAVLPEPPSAMPGPSQEDMAAAAEMSSEDQQDMIRTMVARLADRLEENPDDLEGWKRLAGAYDVLGDAAEAREAYARAAALAPEDVEVLLDYAGSILETSDGKQVPPQAVAVLKQVLDRDPGNPDALWFTGLAEAQAGQNEAAAAIWRRLLDLLPPEDRRVEIVRRQLEELTKGE
jgi:cytochrome c-type biogenesis protein CcmH